jgi:predicted CopG family antitoxin
MGFTSETAREAGRKSKRGKDNFSDEIKELLQIKAKDIINDLDVQSLSSNQRIKVLSIILPYLISKQNLPKAEEKIDLPIFLE